MKHKYNLVLEYKMSLFAESWDEAEKMALDAHGLATGTDATIKECWQVWNSSKQTIPKEVVE